MPGIGSPSTVGTFMATWPLGCGFRLRWMLRAASSISLAGSSARTMSAMVAKCSGSIIPSWGKVSW